MIWISDYIHIFFYDIELFINALTSTAVDLTVVEIKAWVSNCILLFDVDVNTYRCANPEAGFTNLF